MNVKLSQDEKKFWSWWVLANGIGFPVGFILAIILSYAVANIFYPKETNLIVGLCVGGVVHALITGFALLKLFEFPIQNQSAKSD